MAYRCPMGRPTVKDVARLAQVSAKTVSNVMNGGVHVNDQTRRRVLAAMDELDYVPNLAARGLRNGRTGIIALALPDLSTAYSAEMIHHMVIEAKQRGWSLLLEETGADGAREEQLLTRARHHEVDGLVLNPIRAETTPLDTSMALPPVVTLGEVRRPTVDHVWVDNEASSRQLTEVLLRHGPRVALLGTLDTETARRRRDGYRLALSAAGVPVDPELEIPCKDWDPEHAYTAVDHHLRSHPAPDSIFCMTDTLAVGALHALWQHRLSVPGHVWVAGYDDVALSAHLPPPLTSVSFSRREICAHALDLLARRIAEPDRPVEVISVPHRVVQRESTGGP